MKEIAHREQYKLFKWKRMHVANITKVLNITKNACHEHVLNERECVPQTLHRF